MLYRSTLSPTQSTTSAQVSQARTQFLARRHISVDDNIEGRAAAEANATQVCVSYEDNQEGRAAAEANTSQVCLNSKKISMDVFSKPDLY